MEELPEDGEVTYELADTSALRPATEQPLNDAPVVKIPVTIITGYLGSGKLTLLDRISKTSGLRLAIILNEFGDSLEIERAVTVADRDESVQEWLDLGNGCLCCTVKDNGVAAIERLVENLKGRIDYILLETTGVADPAPIAKMFWLDDGLLLLVYIDGVVTVVDAENIEQCLDDVGGHWHREHGHVDTREDLTEEEIQQQQDRLHQGVTTAHLQIALADSILLNKIDRVKSKPDSEAKIAKIINRIRGINAQAPVLPTSFGNIALDRILNLHAFEANTKNWPTLTYHDERISTICITFPFLSSAEDFGRIEAFLQHLLWEKEVKGQPVEVHRVKGLLAFGDDVRVVQGVRDTYEIIEGASLLEGVEECKMVFIGKNLVEKDVRQQLLEYKDKK